jgi:uncharacterized membrane protein HdeD (DUF308 family)
MGSSRTGGEVSIGPMGLGIAREGTTLLFIAIVTVVLGVLVLAWPDKTLGLLSVLVGIHLLVFGLFRLIRAFADDAISPGFSALIGILGMVVGVVVVRNPFETAVVLATLLGVVWIVIGAIDVLSAIADRSIHDRWLVGVAGLISGVAGLIVVSWPGPSVTVIAVIAGIYLVVIGLLLAVQALWLRSVARSA